MSVVPLRPHALPKAIAVALAVLASSTHAQQAAEVAKLESITVTGSRAPTALSDLSTSISVVGEAEVREQLELKTNILGALDVLVPGLTVSRGEARSGCSTNIRGRQAQFLINGVPTNDNLRRSNCGSLFGINPFAIERIEVQRGATSTFGAGAPGGVINLLMRQARSSALEVDAAVQWGVNPGKGSDTAESTVYLGGGQRREGWDYYIGGAFQDYGARRNPNGGLVPGAEFDAVSLHASAGAKLGPGTLRLTGLFNREDPGTLYASDGTQVAGERFADKIAKVEPPNPYAGQAKTEQTVLTAVYSLADVASHQLDFSLFLHREQLIQRSADPFEGQVFYTDSDADNRRIGFRSTASRQFKLGSSSLDLSYGLDLLRQSYYRPLVNPANGAVTGYIAPEVILDSQAVFVQPQWRRGPWLLNAGVRHERFSGEVGDKGYNPSLPRAATPGKTPSFSLTLWNAGFVYDIDPALQLFGGFNQGAEISEFGRAARGASNPSLINLDGATSDQIELGLRGRRGPVDFSLAVFRSKSDKAASLQPDPSCAGQPICPLIPLRLAQRLHGLELTADWRVNPAWNLGTLVTWQKGRFNQPGTAPVPFGTDTVSPPRATLYAEFNAAGGWRARVQGTQFGKTDSYDEAQQAAGYRNTDSVFLMDASASVPWGSGRLSVGMANLLDREYVNVTNQASGDFFYYLSEGRRVTLSWQGRF